MSHNNNTLEVKDDGECTGSKVDCKKSIGSAGGSVLCANIEEIEVKKEVSLPLPETLDDMPVIVQTAGGSCQEQNVDQEILIGGSSHASPSPNRKRARTEKTESEEVKSSLDEPLPKIKAIEDENLQLVANVADKTLLRRQTEKQACKEAEQIVMDLHVKIKETATKTLEAQKMRDRAFQLDFQAARKMEEARKRVEFSRIKAEEARRIAMEAYLIYCDAFELKVEADRGRNMAHRIAQEAQQTSKQAHTLKLKAKRKIEEVNKTFGPNNVTDMSR